jgi:hypothetical protein
LLALFDQLESSQSCLPKLGRQTSRARELIACRGKTRHELEWFVEISIPPLFASM